MTLYLKFENWVNINASFYLSFLSAWKWHWFAAHAESIYAETVFHRALGRRQYRRYVIYGGMIEDECFEIIACNEFDLVHWI